MKIGNIKISLKDGILTLNWCIKEGLEPVNQVVICFSFKGKKEYSFVNKTKKTIKEYGKRVDSRVVVFNLLTFNIAFTSFVLNDITEDDCSECGGTGEQWLAEGDNDQYEKTCCDYC